MKVWFYVVCALLLGGCIKEDRSDCVALRLEMCHTIHNYGGDLFAERIGDLRVYVFDRDQRLVEVVTPTQQELQRASVELDLDTGRYAFVGWASDCEELAQTECYEVYDLVRGDVVVGESRMEDLRVRMLSEDGGASGVVVPSSQELDDLFFATTQWVDLVRGETKSVVLDFLKNNNILDIEVQGINNLVTRGVEPVVTMVVGENDCYKFDNSIDEQSVRVSRHDHKVVELTESKMKSQIEILKLEIDHHTTSPMLLHVQNAVTQSDIVDPIDILDAILRIEQAEPIGAAWRVAKYQSQSDLDREDRYSFGVKINDDLTVTIFVDGYELVNLRPEL